MRIAVFGTGGVGGYFGGRLAQAGESVVFIARGKTLEALRTNGLRVDSIKGDFVVPKVNATDDDATGTDPSFEGAEYYEFWAEGRNAMPLIGRLATGTFGRSDVRPGTLTAVGSALTRTVPSRRSGAG